MQFFKFLPLFAVGVLSAVLPTETIEQREADAELGPRQGSTACLNNAQATAVANNFKTLINNYSNVAADKYLTSDFKDYSDSVNILIDNGCPNGPKALGGSTATFSSRADFEAGQGGQPNIPFTILNVWTACNVVIVRWDSSNPNATVTPVEPVTGIAALETTINTNSSTRASVPYAIQTVYSEFNSGAWLYDIGIFKPSC